MEAPTRAATGRRRATSQGASPLDIPPKKRRDMRSRKPGAGRDPWMFSFPDGNEIDAAIRASGLDGEQRDGAVRIIH